MIALRVLPGRLSQSLQRWLFDPVPVHSMLICRIGLGSVLFLAYLFRWSMVDTLYGPEGYAGYAYFLRYPGSGSIGWPTVEAYDQLQHVSSGATIWALYLALLVSSLCFALGVWPKLTGTITLVLHSLFLGRNAGSYWGWATMIRPFLVYTILASSGRHLSIVAWIRARRGVASTPVEWTRSAWPQRLLQVHVACAFLVFWARIDEESWLSGQMLYLALQSRAWGRLDIDWFPLRDYLEVVCKATLALELGAPIALWIRPIGKYWALGLMAMFGGLMVMTSVGWWDVVMLCALTTFLPVRWLQRAMGQDERRPLGGCC